MGGLFIAWLAMHIIGETGAKYSVAGVATIVVLAELDFGTDEARMGSTGQLIGLVILLIALLRPRSKRPSPEQQ